MAKKSIQNYTTAKVDDMNFMVADALADEKYLKIFRLNSMKYIVSEKLIARCHDINIEKVKHEDVFSHILNEY
jgi:hypothetical protein